MSIQNAVSNDYSRLAEYASTPEQINSIKNHIAKSIQDGMLPAYEGVPLITSLNTKLGEIQKAAAMRSGLVPNQPTIAQNALASAQPQGIEAAQSNLPESYAGGGIIAFANEGLVDDEAQLPEGGVYPEEEEEEEQATPSSWEQAKKALSGVGSYLSHPLQGTVADQVLPAIGKGIGSGFSKGIEAIGSTRYAFTPKPGEPSFEGPVKPSASVTPPAPTTEAKKALTPDEIAAGAKISDRPRVARPAVAAPAAAPMTQEPAPSTTSVDSGIDSLKEMQDRSDQSREDLKQLILGSDDSESKLKQRALLALMQGGFKAAAGTSPYAAVNIGAGGEEGAKAFAEGIAQIDADKRNKISQLVNLGLKGQELDQAAARLGLTQKDLAMHAPLIAAQARQAESAAAENYAQAQSIPAKLALQRQRITAAGVAKPIKLTSSDIKNLDAKEAAWRADPAGAFGNNLSTQDVMWATKYPNTANGAKARAKIDALSSQKREIEKRKLQYEKSGL